MMMAEVENMDMVTVFILPHKFQKKRLTDIKKSMRNKNISFSDTLSSQVTHIVTECVNYEQAIKFLESDKLEVLKGSLLVSTSWLVDCLKNSKIMPVLDFHKIKKAEVTTVSTESFTENSEWACQRGAKLNHFNEKFTEALELLQCHAELRNDSSDYSRALAFRRASCVLKALPFVLTDVKQLNGWKDIGDHVRRIITDILDFGSSIEVEEIRYSDWFCKMKLFTNVFGIGPANAKVWINKGWKSIEDARAGSSSSKDWRIIWGLAFYEDLSTPVQLQEVHAFEALLMKLMKDISPLIIITVTGGFRRGKNTGHDIDILLTHPTEGEEAKILPKLLEALDKNGFILKGQTMKNTFSSEIFYQDSKTNLRSNFDHFEKWLGICKFPKSFKEISESLQDNLDRGLQITQSHQEYLHPHISSLLKPSNNLNTELQNCGGSIQQSYDQASNTNDRGTSAVSKREREESEEPDGAKIKRCKYEELNESEVKLLAAESREWIARRVDLIVAPYSQYFYALVGWTGSKHFNRDARLYAQKVLGLKLTSHGLYDMKKMEGLSASSEEEVFRYLKLPYRDPSERNL